VGDSTFTHLRRFAGFIIFAGSMFKIVHIRDCHGNWNPTWRDLRHPTLTLYIVPPEARSKISIAQLQMVKYWIYWLVLNFGFYRPICWTHWVRPLSHVSKCNIAYRRSDVLSLSTTTVVCSQWNELWGVFFDAAVYELIVSCPGRGYDLRS
jgi:hypothetical protein